MNRPIELAVAPLIGALDASPAGVREAHGGSLVRLDPHPDNQLELEGTPVSENKPSVLEYWPQQSPIDIETTHRTDLTLLEFKYPQKVVGTFHRGDGLTLCPAQVVTEVGHVTGRDPAHDEPLAVGRDEPLGELLDVVGERPAGVRGEVVVGEEADDEGRLGLADRDAVENIIAPVPTAFWTQIRQHVDAPRP